MAILTMQCILSTFGISQLQHQQLLDFWKPNSIKILNVVILVNAFRTDIPH
jgi:23S rRNA A1618 N6-methylase RlmF